MLHIIINRFRTGIIKLHKHRSPSQESRLAIGGSSEQAVERAWIWPAEAWRGVTKLVWEDSDLTHAGPAAGGRTRGQRRRRRRQTSRRQRPRTTTGSGIGARDWPPPGLRLPRRRAGTRTRARVMRISSGCRGSWADAGIAETPGIAGRVLPSLSFDFSLNLNDLDKFVFFVTFVLYCSL